MTDREKEWLRLSGINPSRDLARACSEFYVLERLVADKVGPAGYRLDNLETTLAHEFAAYFEYAVATEIKGMKTIPRILSRSCCDECCHYHTPDNECCFCEEEEDDCGNRARSPRILGPVAHAIEAYATSRMSRSDSLDYWREWQNAKRLLSNPNDILGLAAEAFVAEGRWSVGSWGGPPWANIARLTHDYTVGRITPRVYVNMAWSLEHNCGCAFDKVEFGRGNLKRLMSVLARQAAGEYDFLASMCGEDVRQLWQLRPSNPRYGCDEAWLGTGGGMV